MTDGEALLRAIVGQPVEDTPRLAYADWLDEHAQPDRAELIRVQVELAKHPRRHVIAESVSLTRHGPDYWECGGGAFTDHGILVNVADPGDRVDVMRRKTPMLGLRLVKYLGDPDERDGRGNAILARDAESGPDPAAESRVREKALLPANGRNAAAWFDGPWWAAELGGQTVSGVSWLCNPLGCPWFSIIHPATGMGYQPPTRMRFCYVRGFVGHVGIAWEDFLLYRGALLKGYPIQEVTLLTEPPVEWGHSGRATPVPDLVRLQGVGDFRPTAVVLAEAAKVNLSGREWLLQQEFRGIKFGLPPFAATPQPQGAAT